MIIKWRVPGHDGLGQEGGGRRGGRLQERHRAGGGQLQAVPEVSRLLDWAQWRDWLIFREMYETSKTAEREVTKSKSMSLKSQLKSPFKFLGKTYCGGCKVWAQSITQCQQNENLKWLFIQSAMITLLGAGSVYPALIWPMFVFTLGPRTNDPW